MNVSVEQIIEATNLHIDALSLEQDNPCYDSFDREQVRDIMIEKYNLEENIALLGWQDQNRVIDILQKSDILLAPSITAADSDMEGIPMVLMKAMAMGIPVISTYHSGIPELIKDGKPDY